MHNHPSGDPTPTATDIDITRRISQAGRELGVVVHDHVVITRSGHTKLPRRGFAVTLAMERIDRRERRYPARPFVGVGAVVFKERQVLLVRRGRPPRQGLWSLPGGLQELGETVFTAAAREVLEETGLTVEIVELVDVVDSITQDAEGRVQYHYTLVDVRAEWRAGEAVAGDDAEEVVWVPLDDLARYDLWRETERVIRRAAAQRCGR